jgi:putative membrane protein
MRGGVAGLLETAVKALENALFGFFNWAHETGEDLRALSAKPLLLCGMLAIPALLFYLYVGAFYDPMGNMKNTKVYLANMDKGQYSQAVEGAILASNIYSFEKADYEYAREKVLNGEAWAVLVIPPDFSSDLENGKDTQLVLVMDEQDSYIVARVLKPTFMLLADRIGQSFSKSANREIGAAVSTLSAQDYLTSQQLAALSSGSAQLAAGQGNVTIGSGTLSSYSSELAGSERDLSSNLRIAGYSAGSLRSGLDDMQSGTGELENGAKTLQNGTSQLITVNRYMNTALAQSLLAANSLDNSTAKAQLIYMLQTTYGLSQMEGAGLAKVNSGAGRLSSGASSLYYGLGQASDGAGSLEGGLYTASDSGYLLSSSTDEAALSLNTLSQGSEKISDGQGKMTTSLSLLSDKQATISDSLGQVDEHLSSSPSIGLSVMESNKNDYGTLFATAFLVLGLFFGSASAYIFASLNGLKHPKQSAAIVCFFQALLLLAAYLLMGFPSRGGTDALFALMFLTSLVLMLFTYTIVSMITPKFTSESLQLVSPLVSLLAVFMISSGGALWPQHTLEGHFANYAPYIPFYHAVMSIRASALGAGMLYTSVAALFGFCAIFIAVPAALQWVRARKSAALTPAA